MTMLTVLISILIFLMLFVLFIWTTTEGYNRLRERRMDNPKPSRIPKNVDIIVSQARSRVRQ